MTARTRARTVAPRCHRAERTFRVVSVRRSQDCHASHARPAFEHTRTGRRPLLHPCGVIPRSPAGALPRHIPSPLQGRGYAGSRAQRASRSWRGLATQRHAAPPLQAALAPWGASFAILSPEGARVRGAQPHCLPMAAVTSLPRESARPVLRPKLSGDGQTPDKRGGAGFPVPPLLFLPRV